MPAFDLAWSLQATAGLKVWILPPRLDTVDGLQVKPELPLLTQIG